MMHCWKPAMVAICCFLTGALAPALAQRRPAFEDDRALPAPDSTEMERARKAREDARREAETEARRRTEETTRRQVETEARRRDEEARREAETEARRRTADDERRRVETEMRRRSDDAARRSLVNEPVKPEVKSRGRDERVKSGRSQPETRRAASRASRDDESRSPRSAPGPSERHARPSPLEGGAFDAVATRYFRASRYAGCQPRCQMTFPCPDAPPPAVVKETGATCPDDGVTISTDVRKALEVERTDMERERTRLEKARGAIEAAWSRKRPPADVYGRLMERYKCGISVYRHERANYRQYFRD